MNDLLALQVQSEFEILKDDQQRLQHKRRKDFETARLKDNKKRNRYTDVLPYDSTRVVLSTGNNDYINASWIKNIHPTRNYIATQGPVESTIGDFWQMIYECKVKAIVMLTQLTEKNVQKCFEYWPTESIEYGDNRVTVKCIDTIENEEYELRKFLINGEHETWHFYYKEWADFATPRKPIKHLIDAVNDKVGKQETVLVHCSAGIGRTGTFIAIDALDGGTKESIFDIVTKLREQRLGMVQSIQQYAYIHMYNAEKVL